MLIPFSKISIEWGIMEKESNVIKVSDTLNLMVLTLKLLKAKSCCA
jgi:hypothetical protein